MQWNQSETGLDGSADFATLVRRHQSMVFSIALHYLNDRGAAEEVAQEVFLQLYRHTGTWASDEHRTAWLRRVACHRSIDAARSRKNDPRVALDELPEPAAVVSEDDVLLRERLRRLVAGLSENARKVVLLRFQEELEPEEIARALEMPIGTVKSHLQRSLALLRDKLGRMNVRVASAEVEPQ